MKHWNWPRFKFLKSSAQKGQAVVEFVLLLAAMATITYFFVQFMNSNLSKYWEYSINLIVNDRPAKTLRLP